MGFHPEVLQRHLLPLSQNHQVVGFPGIQPQQHGKIGLNIDFLPVQLQNFVPHLKAIRSIDGGKAFKAADHRHYRLLGRQIDDDHQQYAHKEIHGSPGR